MLVQTKKWHYMIRLYTIFIFILTLANTGALQAQSGMLSSYEGRHFYVGFLDNEISLYQDPYMSIYVTSKFDTEVTVYEPQSNRTYTFVLKKDEVAPIEVTRGYEHKLSEIVHNSMLMEISSTQPISCVAKSSLVQSSDKFSIIPTRNWGYEHFAVSMPNDYYIEPLDQNPIIIEDQKTPRLGEFLVMARENSTRVEITMAAESFAGIAKDSTFAVMLDRGESYLVKSKAVHGVKGIHDLSGSRIKSNKPVGVVSGHMRSSIKQVDYFSRLGAKDHLVEMIPPTATWSNQYVSVPFGNDIKSMFKVVAKDTLTLNMTNELNSNSIEMLPGEVHTFDNVELATSWVADGKFLLVQFMAKYSQNLNFEYYDPAMVIIPPLDKMVNDVTYYASNTAFAWADGSFRQQYLYQSVLLIADEKGYESITVNGINVETMLGFNEFIANGKKVYWEKVFVGAEPKSVTIKADSGSFHAIAIGNGIYDSYAMTVGASLIDEKDIEESKPVIDFTETCSSVEGQIYDPVVSSVSGINYVHVDKDYAENVRWYISEITDTTTAIDFNAEVIDKNKPSKLKFEVYDYSGNSEIYNFEYDGALIQLLDNVNYGEINAKQDSCYRFVLKTYADSVMLESVDLPEDLRLKLTPILDLPKMLYKGQDQYYTLCLDNEPGNFQSVLDSIQFNFGCDYSEMVYVRADVISYNLTANDLVLPKILSGTTHNSSAEEYIEFRNAGNADIVVTELEMPTNSNFTIDTVGVFPKTLYSGSTIRFDKISFSSDVIGEDQITIRLIDDQEINREATITAYVGAPAINNIFYDFGNTRIGTGKETSLSFENTGTYDSEFSLVSVESNLDNDPNVALLEAGLNLQIGENDNQELEFNYNPIDVNDFDQYQLYAKFVERWSGHDTITILLRGQPTLPKISTVNIDMDTIKLGMNRDTSLTIIESLGNEDLEIEEISKLYGDESIFEFDKSFYNKRTLAEGASDILSIRFNGLQLGYHEMKLIVKSDALPNYNIKLDTIIIIGFVEELDTLDATVSAENIAVPSCNYDTLEVTVTNTGNTIFVVNDIRPSFVGGSAALLTAFTPDTLLINESLTKEIEVFVSGNRQQMIDYEVDVYDLDQDLDTMFTYQSEIQSLQQAIVINPYDIQAVNIGDEFDIRFSGGFPHYIDTTADVSFKINIDDYNFHLTDESTVITFYNAMGEIVKTVESNLESNMSSIVLESPEFNSFNFDEVVSWDFELRFLTLLTSDLEGDISIIINVDDCYEENDRTTTLDVEEICAFNLRNVELRPIITDTQLKSNIISEELELEVNSSGEVGAAVYIMDISGKKYYVFNKLMFDKGKNNIILNLSDYANGKYILIIDSQSSISKQEFIITK